MLIRIKSPSISNLFPNYWFPKKVSRRELNTLKRLELPFKYGDLQLLPEVDHLPHLEVPYPNTNGGQHFRRASGSCPSILLHGLPAFWERWLKFEN